MSLRHPLTALAFTVPMTFLAGCVLSGEPEESTQAPPSAAPLVDGDKGLGVDPNGGGKPTPGAAPGSGGDPGAGPVRRQVRAPADTATGDRGAGLDPNG